MYCNCQFLKWQKSQYTQIKLANSFVKNFPNGENVGNRRMQVVNNITNTTEVDAIPEYRNDTCETCNICRNIEVGEIPQLKQVEMTNTWLVVKQEIVFKTS